MTAAPLIPVADRVAFHAAAARLAALRLPLPILPASWSAHDKGRQSMSAQGAKNTGPACGVYRERSQP